MVLAQKQTNKKIGWNRIENPEIKKKKEENPEINPCSYDHLNYDKGGKNIHWGLPLWSSG